jgi:hypothetical protein
MNKLKKVFYIVFIINVFSFCESKKNFIEKDVVNLLNQEVLEKKKNKNNLILPISYSYIPVFGLTENNFLVCTSTDCLYYVYSNFYKKEFPNFKDFLCDFLNQKIIIPKKKFSSTKTFFITLDEKVTKDYDTYEFSEFYNKYCSVNNNVTSIKRENYQNGVNKNKLFSIIYYLSINNYYVDENDYIGLYYVKNWDDVIKKGT